MGAGHRGSTGMTGLDPTLATAENYRRFAVYEAAGRSPAYERLAYAVAQDDLVLSFLERLPLAKRQPNLLFAAARYLLGSPPAPGSLRSLVSDRPGQLAGVMRARRTQTNEAARCAVLLPALALLTPPLALVEARCGRWAHAPPRRLLLRLRRPPASGHGPGSTHVVVPAYWASTASSAGP